jgi:hypothetical protein
MEGYCEYSIYRESAYPGIKTMAKMELEQKRIPLPPGMVLTVRLNTGRDLQKAMMSPYWDESMDRALLTI